MFSPNLPFTSQADNNLFVVRSSFLNGDLKTKEKRLIFVGFFITIIFVCEN